MNPAFRPLAPAPSVRASTRATRRDGARRPNQYAVEQPTIPPPTMATSYAGVRSRSVCCQCETVILTSVRPPRQFDPQLVGTPTVYVGPQPTVQDSADPSP